MPTEEAVLSVTIAFAPYDRVMPAVVGLFRARFGYSIAEPCPGESQIARLKRLEAEETQANVIHVNSTLVSEPAGSSGITLIEDWFGIWASELGSLLPDVTFLSLFSLFESKGCEQHRFTLRRGPDTLREVDLDRNMCKSGWCWHEKGAPQPWEDAARSVDRAISRRLDRALLVEYAARHGVDLDETLAERRLERPLFLHGISSWDARADLRPATLGQSYHDAAVLAGFGEGETRMAFDTQADEAAQAQNIDRQYAEVRKAIGKSRSATGLLKTMTDLGPAPADGLAQTYYIGLYREVLHRAFQKFPDDPATEALARRAIAETGTLKHGVSEVEVLRMRPQMAAARGKTDIVKRYREMIRVAKSPAELAEASVEIYALRDPDVDHQFKINAMDEFLRAAIKRDPVHRSTNDLARMLDHLAAHAGQVPQGATGPGTHLLNQALSKAGR